MVSREKRMERLNRTSYLKTLDDGSVHEGNGGLVHHPPRRADPRSAHQGDELFVLKDDRGEQTLGVAADNDDPRPRRGLGRGLPDHLDLLPLRELAGLQIHLVEERGEGAVL